MAEQSITDLEIELSTLQTRLDAMRTEVTVFLNEVGAPSLTEARDRYRRFAAAAIELPQKIDRLQAELRAAHAVKETLAVTAQANADSTKSMRIALNNERGFVSKTNNRLNVARAALVEAKDLLESPMYASMIDDSRRTIRSLDSALTAIPFDLPVTEEETNAAISG